jgi:hypothetical protein
LATFSNAGEVNALMGYAHRLKNSGIGISRDYPREISDARKSLWPEFKRKRDEFGKENVKILYPAALLVNGRITRNFFPDWHDILKESRITDVHKRISDSLKSKSDNIRQAYDAQLSTHDIRRSDDGPDQPP